MQNIFIVLISALFWVHLPMKQSEEKKWPDQLQTAKDAGYMNKLEQEVILELNKVRSNPKRFAEEYMEELQTAFSGKLYTYPGQEPVMSKEGRQPLMECIRVLENTAPMPILKPAEGLTKASRILVNDQQSGGIGHITRNGLTPRERIEKCGEWNICLSENIDYGSFEARQIVIALLIDDGVPDRGHRKNILNPCFQFAGVAVGKHPKYRIMCVMDFAGEYKTKED